MAQLLPKRPTLGEILGSSVGQGVSQGLGRGIEELAQIKLQQLQQGREQQRTAQALKSMVPGLSDEDAMNVAMGGPQMASMWVKEMMKAPGNERYARLMQRAAAGEPLDQESYISPYIKQEIGYQPQQVIQEPRLVEEMSANDIINEYLGQQQSQYGQEVEQQDPMQQPEQQVSRKRMLGPDFSGLNERQIADIVKTQQRSQLAQLAEKKYEQATEKSIAPYITKKMEEYQGIKIQDKLLKDIRDLSYSKNANSPAMAQLWTKLDMPWMLSDDTTLLNKKGAELFRDLAMNTKNLRNKYTAERFAESLPQIRQNPSAIREIVNSLLSTNKLKKVNFKALMTELENKDYSSLSDLLMKTEKRASKNRKSIENKIDKSVTNAMKGVGQKPISYELPEQKASAYSEGSRALGDDGNAIFIVKNGEWERV